VLCNLPAKRYQRVMISITHLVILMLILLAICVSKFSLISAETGSRLLATILGSLGFFWCWAKSFQQAWGKLDWYLSKVLSTWVVWLRQMCGVFLFGFVGVWVFLTHCSICRRWTDSQIPISANSVSTTCRGSNYFNYCPLDFWNKYMLSTS